MEKLLVAVDFSSASAHAVQYASWLKLQTKAGLEALHVYSAPKVEETLSKKTKDQFLRHYRSDLMQHLKRFTTPAPDRAEEPLSSVGRLHCRLREGKVVDQIIVHAKEEKTDLIVVGTRAKHQLWNHLFGSVTTELIARSPCPVLVVPEGSNYRQVHRIAFASEITLDETSVFNWLESFANSLDAGVERFFVNVLPEEQDKWKEELIRTTWEAAPASIRERITMIREKTVLKGIDYYLEKYPSEMLALYVPQRAFVERLLHRSLSRQLAYQTQIPLLVVKHANHQSA
jgi:nucleotide-binding universal stress UspA family protein